MTTGNDDNKRTSFPCLVVVRYMVCGVVSVLAVFFIAMVIAVNLRGPDNFHFSIVQGHVEASALWSKKPIIPHPQQGQGSCRGRGGEEDSSCPYMYEAVPYTILWVTLSAHNPSGRFSIHCYNISYRILDMPDGPNSFKGMVQIVSRSISDFQVSPQSTHRQRRSVRVDDASVLSYMARTYAGKTSFPAMVQVHATITFVRDTILKSSHRSVSQWCWPVTVGLDEPGNPTDEIDCKPR